MMEFYCSQDRTLRGGDIWAGVWVIRRDKMWEFWRKSYQEEKFEGCHGKLCSPCIAQMHLARGRRRVRNLVQSCAVRFDAASSRRIAGFCLFSIYLFIYLFLSFHCSFLIRSSSTPPSHPFYCFFLLSSLSNVPLLLLCSFSLSFIFSCFTPKRWFLIPLFSALIQMGPWSNSTY